ncbi:MAG: hypothetical protein ACK5M5_03250 [Limnobaculum xujianqingii]
MNKLFKLKEWLTLEETTRRLTLVLQEEVNISDILQLALDGRITISALIEESKYAIKAKKESVNLIERFNKNLLSNEEVDPLIKAVIKDLGFPDEEFFSPYESAIIPFGGVFKLPSGVYDLPMIGAEKLDILHICSTLQGREPVTLINLNGPYLLHEGNYVNIMAPFDEKTIRWCPNDDGEYGLKDFKKKVFIDENNYHASFYPDDGLRLNASNFVFRRENIEIFERSLNESSNNIELDFNTGILLLGGILKALKNATPKSKQWTQDALKQDIVDMDIGIKARKIDDYFSLANQFVKEKLS